MKYVYLNTGSRIRKVGSNLDSYASTTRLVEEESLTMVVDRQRLPNEAAVRAKT